MSWEIAGCDRTQRIKTVSRRVRYLALEFAILQTTRSRSFSTREREQSNHRHCFFRCIQETEPHVPFAHVKLSQLSAKILLECFPNTNLLPNPRNSWIETMDLRGGTDSFSEIIISSFFFLLCADAEWNAKLSKFRLFFFEKWYVRYLVTTFASASACVSCV